MDLHARLRAKIRAGRELLNMTQGELAQYIGVSLSKISKAETGETKSGDILLEIQKSLESLGIIFTERGIELAQNHIDIIEGEGCYVRLLDDVYNTLSQISDKELLIMFASDKVSPPVVNDRYRFMRRQGISMRQLIQEEDTYIMGRLDEYKTVPQNYFTNVVTLIYANKVAQVSGDETRISIHTDQRLAERERQVFSYFWDNGGTPKKSTAKEKFEE